MAKTKTMVAPAVKAAAPEGGTVTVACKLPHGLFLRNFTMIERDEPVMGGGTKVAKVAQEKGDRIRINGVAVPFGAIPNYPIVGGYALTQNVDADFWNEWLRANRDSDVVKNKLIFAHATPAQAHDQSTEQQKVRSGLEPIDPNNLPKGIEKFDGKAA